MRVLGRGLNYLRLDGGGLLVLAADELLAEGSVLVLGEGMVEILVVVLVVVCE